MASCYGPDPTSWLIVFLTSFLSCSMLKSDIAMSPHLCVSSFLLLLQVELLWTPVHSLWTYTCLYTWKPVLVSWGKHQAIGWTDNIYGIKKLPSYFPKGLHSFTFPQQWRILPHTAGMGAVAFSGVRGGGGLFNAHNSVGVNSLWAPSTPNTLLKSRNPPVLSTLSQTRTGLWTGPEEHLTCVSWRVLFIHFR